MLVNVIAMVTEAEKMGTKVDAGQNFKRYEKQ
jgi:hypothetical protein